MLINIPEAMIMVGGGEGEDEGDEYCFVVHDDHVTTLWYRKA